MPKPTSFPYRLESDRLILRCYDPADAPVLFEAVQESLLSLSPWLPWAQSEPTLAFFEAFVRRSRGEYDLMTNFNLAIYSKADGRYLGGTGLHRFDWETGRFEIGYWLRDSAVGHGYVSEAAWRLAEFAFEDLKAERVELRVDVDNVRSRRVAERLGFKLEGVLRAWARRGDELRDLAVYSMIRAEYASLPS
ncbi:MAG TPA: GNAT family protein [Stenomitos sp.]